jgi:hypothetical protein
MELEAANGCARRKFGVRFSAFLDKIKEKIRMIE